MASATSPALSIMRVHTTAWQRSSKPFSWLAWKTNLKTSASRGLMPITGSRAAMLRESASSGWPPDPATVCSAARSDRQAQSGSGCSGGGSCAASPAGAPCSAACSKSIPMVKRCCRSQPAMFRPAAEAGSNAPIMAWM